MFHSEALHGSLTECIPTAPWIKASQIWPYMTIPTCLPAVGMEVISASMLPHPFSFLSPGQCSHAPILLALTPTHYTCELCSLASTPIQTNPSCKPHMKTQLSQEVFPNHPADTDLPLL